jgi:putative aldouronate transport system substrate-binding protein
MLRRLLLLLLATAILVSASACAGGAPSGSTSAASTTTAATTAAKAADTAATTANEAADTELAPYVIKYNLLSNEVSEDKELVEAKINEIIKPLINATIKFNMITWGDWDAKANVALQAGEKVDITFTADWYNFVRSVSQNQFLPLNDPDSEFGELLYTYAPEACSSLGESFLKGVQIKGINYSIPTNKELTVPGAYQYNLDIVEKYEIDITKIKNDDDIEPWLEIIKAGEPDDFVVYPTDGGWSRANFVSIVPELQDYRMYSDRLPDGTFDPTIIFMWEDEDYLRNFDRMRDWYLKGYIHPDSYLDNYNKDTTRFAGKFFFVDSAVKGFNGVMCKEHMAQSDNPNLRLTEFQVRDPVYITLHAGGSMLAVPYTSDDPARAVMYINLMHSNELLINTMVWGVEDKNYEKIGPKQVRVSDVSPWISKHGGPWTMGDQINKQWVGEQEDVDKYANMAAFNATGFPHISLGFRFDRTNVDSEITAYNNVRSMSRSIMVGAVDPREEIPKMVEAMKAAGSEKIRAELNKQFTEWLNEQ